MKLVHGLLCCLQAIGGNGNNGEAITALEFFSPNQAIGIEKYGLLAGRAGHLLLSDHDESLICFSLGSNVTLLVGFDRVHGAGIEIEHRSHAHWQGELPGLDVDFECRIHRGAAFSC